MEGSATSIKWVAILKSAIALNLIPFLRKVALNLSRDDTIKISDGDLPYAEHNRVIEALD